MPSRTETDSFGNSLNAFAFFPKSSAVPGAFVFELAQKLKQLSPATRVVLLAGWLGAEEIKRGADVGAERTMLWPSSHVEVVALVNDLTKVSVQAAGATVTPG